jgi:hypothetical protein
MSKHIECVLDYAAAVAIAVALFCVFLSAFNLWSI